MQGKQTKNHNKAGQGIFSNIYSFIQCCRCSLFTGNQGNEKLKPDFTADTSLSHVDK